MSVKTFLFVHNIGKKRFHNLVKHYQLNGVSCTVHANIRQYSRNAAPFAEGERAVTFIKNYAEIHAVPLPGKLQTSLLVLQTARAHQDKEGSTNLPETHCGFH